MPEMQLQYWRIEDLHYACHDIRDEDGNFITTYEVDLYANRKGYSWAQHIAEKNWAFDALIFELAQLETAFADYSYQNPLESAS